MKFLGMNMADALLLAIAGLIAVVAVALPVGALIAGWGTLLEAAMIGVAALFAVIAYKLAHRVLVNPLPVFEHVPQTEYRPKTVT